MANEIAFKAHLLRISKCTTTKELYEASKFRDNKGNLVEWYSMKFFNKQFKGNFKKAKEFLIKDAHIGYNNACEDEIFN